MIETVSTTSTVDKVHPGSRYITVHIFQHFQDFHSASATNDCSQPSFAIYFHKTPRLNFFLMANFCQSVAKLMTWRQTALFLACLQAV